MRKRSCWSGILLVFLITLCALAFSACQNRTPDPSGGGGSPTKGSAALPEGNVELTYEMLSDGTYEVRKASEKGEIAVVPAEYRGKKVSSIGETAFRSDKLEKVFVSDGVKTVKESAFSNCPVLEEIFLPESVEDIAVYAIKNCTNVRYTEYNGGKYLGTQTNPYAVLLEVSDGSATEFVLHPDTKVISGSAFSYLDPDNISKVVLPEGLKAIGDYAFDLSLTEFYLPASVTHVGKRILYSRKLQKIEVAAGNERYYSAQNCLIDRQTKTVLAGSNTSDLSLLTDIKVIGNTAFHGCTELKKILLPEGVEVVEEWAFAECESADELRLPQSLTSIGNLGFADCRSLKEIAVPESVTRIGYGAFQNCTSLASVRLPERVEEFGNGDGFGMFANNLALKEVRLPQGIRALSDTFAGCENLQSVLLPDSVTDLGQMTFSDCKSLTKVNLPAGLEKIHAQAFFNCEAYPFAVYGNGIYWGNEQNPYFALIAIEYEEERVELTLHPDTRMIADQISCWISNSVLEIPEGVRRIGARSFTFSVMEKVILPASVASIGEDAFFGCENLQEFVVAEGNAAYKTFRGGLIEIDTKKLLYSMADEIPDDGSVTVIGTNAFRKRTMTEIVLPSCVTEIERYAFEGCRELERLVGENVNELGGGAFQDCTALKEVVLTGGLDDLWIADRFLRCENLESITLAPGLQRIFIPQSYGKLKFIYFLGTAEEWSKVEVSFFPVSIGEERTIQVVCADKTVPLEIQKGSLR